MTVEKKLDSLKITEGTGNDLRSAHVFAHVHREDISTVTIVEVATAAIGANYTAFASTPCWQLEIVNNTGTALEYKRGAAGLALTILTGTIKKIKGITDANQISVRRVDQSVTPVTVEAEAFH